MTKVFISQPMRGKTDEYIRKEREHLIKVAKEMYEDVEIIDSYFTDYDGSALKFLSRSIGKLAEADVAIFSADWENARGCCIEHEIALKYDVEVVECYSKMEE